MWESVAAGSSTPGISDQLIIVVGGIISAAIVALGAVLVAIVNSRASRTTPSPPSPNPDPPGTVLYERTAVLARRADDSDERFDVMDRRLDRIERHLDLEDQP